MLFRKISCIAFLLLGANLAYAQNVTPNNYAPPVNDPELKNLVWNKWSTPSFTVMSIDHEQGKYLYQNIEAIKAWTTARWGFNDIKFSAECRILCVPNKNLMKKLFGIEQSTAEVRVDETGKIKLSAIWMVFDGTPIDSIPPNLTLVILKEIEQSAGVKIGFWFKRGSIVLNSSVSQIKSFLGNGTVGFTNQDLLTVEEEAWKALDQSKKDQFDFQSACLCLLLRKEYGQKNMHLFIKNPDPKAVMGFDSDNGFELTLIRFCNNLVADIKKGRTPDDYLIISPLKRA